MSNNKSMIHIKVSPFNFRTFVAFAKAKNSTVPYNRTAIIIISYEIKSNNSSSFSGGVMSGNSGGCGGEGSNILHFSAD